MADEKKYSPPKTGRPKTYTPEQLKKAVSKYFRKITKQKLVTEDVWNGEFDKHGHKIMVPEPALNADGEQIFVTEYLVTPCVASLCDFLGIHRSTWDRYGEQDGFRDTVSYARGRFHNWLEKESLEREDKRLKGITFNLENNYGYKNRVDVSSETMEDYLQNLTEAGEGQTL